MMITVDTGARDDRERRKVVDRDVRPFCREDKTQEALCLSVKDLALTTLLSDSRRIEWLSACGKIPRVSWRQDPLQGRSLSYPGP